MRVWPRARSSYEEEVARPKQSRQAQSRLEQGVGGWGLRGARAEGAVKPKYFSMAPG